MKTVKDNIIETCGALGLPPSAAVYFLAVIETSGGDVDQRTESDAAASAFIASVNRWASRLGLSEEFTLTRKQQDPNLN